MAAAFIEDAIESVRAQNLRPLEVIVVEDCSPDRTADVVRELQTGLADDQFAIRLIRQPENRGGAAALSLGFHEARSDFICWLSADDAFTDEGKLQAQAHQLEGAPSVLSFCRSFYQGATVGEASLVTAHWHRRLPFLDTLLLGHPWARLTALLFVNPINGSTVMIRRTAWIELGDFDSALRNIDQDSDLWMRYSALGAEFRMLQEPSGFYRIHSGQTSGRREDCIVGASATRIRMIMALDAAGMLGRVLDASWPILTVASRAGWHRDRPLVTKFLVSKATGIVRNPITAMAIRRIGAQIQLSGSEQSLYAEACALAQSTFDSDEFTKFVQTLKESNV